MKQKEEEEEEEMGKIEMEEQKDVDVHSWEHRVKNDRSERMVVCKHHNILSQGENEMTKKHGSGDRKGRCERYREGIWGWVNMSQEQTEQQEHIKIH